MARVDLPESKLRARKRRRRFAAAALVAFLFFAAMGLVVGLTRLPHLRVATVEVAGVEGTEATAVKQEVLTHLEGYYFSVFPRDNVILYPRAALTADVLKKFPTFATVEVKATTLRSLKIAITKRSSEAVWCGETRAAPAPCLHLDERGVAYEIAAEFEGAVYTTYYGALGGATLPRQYLNEEAFRALAALASALEGQQSKRVASVEVDAARDVRLRFINGFEVIFVLSDSGGDVYERFTLALTAEPFEGRPTDDFEYLDLRFGDRLYYKIRD
ncbi:MAG: hypothetical protein Q8P58_00200 [Candidatus Adlerbacteria bacterium]|nr:hypothetical protein [Candidatus Adlerbacteria bacterium]